MRPLLLCAVLGALATGCAATPAPKPSAPDVRPSEESAREIVAGETLDIGGQIVRVERLYSAASGRRCAHVRPPPPSDERIACLGDDGRWTLRRELGRLERDEPAPVSARASAMPVAAVPSESGGSEGGIEERADRGVERARD